MNKRMVDPSQSEVAARVRFLERHPELFVFQDLHHLCRPLLSDQKVFRERRLVTGAAGVHPVGLVDHGFGLLFGSRVCFELQQGIALLGEHAPEVILPARIRSGRPRRSIRSRDREKQKCKMKNWSESEGRRRNEEWLP
ncbi:MAG: hypothetical protein EBX52_05940 [Proteobacteria bacterium]|nr:hypothetical protein [Pseudomonadota bacterium]